MRILEKTKDLKYHRKCLLFLYWLYSIFSVLNSKPLIMINSIKYSRDSSWLNDSIIKGNEEKNHKFTSHFCILSAYCCKWCGCCIYHSNLKWFEIFNTQTAGFCEGGNTKYLSFLDMIFMHMKHRQKHNCILFILFIISERCI